jgi:beta-glucosidase
VTIDSGSRAVTWRDASASPADRVRDLLSRMTLREKVAQLYGIWVGIDSGAGEVAPHQHEAAPAPDWDEVIGYGVGQLTRPLGTAPVAPAAGAAALAAAQRGIVAAGRHGIPALVHEECLTGLLAWQATIYPAPLCWGASFDPGLVERVGARIGATMRALGVHQGLAPVLDVTRDLRWGRVEETIGEDPFLVGLIGGAYVRGLESAGAVATLKHFAGYSSSRSARNMAPVSAGPRELADVILPPFEMALAAGARSVMTCYNDVDGLPGSANAAMLTGLLRNRYGFTGTVVADYFAVSFLHSQHGVAAGKGEAAALALAAGLDVELPTVDCFGAPLLAALADGLVDPALIDRAAARVLTQKCELGLLDPDWSPEPPALRGAAALTGGGGLDDPGSRALARELASRSIVLLHNDGVLPLAPGLRVCVTGPRADDPAAMLGCYSFPVHVLPGYPGLPAGVELPTVLAALRADPARYPVSYAPGCPVLGGDDEQLAAAAAAAADADVCVAVLGDRSGMFGAGTSGEGCDAASLDLPGRQGELLDALTATGTPVVLVLLAGRPYDIAAWLPRLAAVVCGFFPGEEGAPALADILSGRVSPSGRLPVSFPGPGGVQGGYRQPRLGQRGSVSAVDPTPLFPFGHGLSYSPATWVSVTVSGAGEWPTDGRACVEVTLRNDHDQPASEVVQVYLHDPVAEVARPVQQLVAAARVDLAPGEAVTAVIGLHADLASYTGREYRRQVDPGEIELRTGASSADIRHVARLAMTGGRREPGPRRVLLPDITLRPAPGMS